ncbi:MULTISPECIES: hypothetical protein [Streptomyces]|uniref:Uncharacterized protein n=1 Tax=Streptomyces cacaoi TaxID=1898 RepID=A0A4Y3QUZ2_STRCI|nr:MULTISPECIES: hypothetical protein [Streptomyces]GEB48769.1 hypothetical protein SCA03_13200 [Streptomyces cacaoi]
MSFGQGGPEWGSGGSSTPDWAALAEEAERDRTRRRRWLLAGGGALATAAIAGIVAFAVVNEGGGDPSAKPSDSLPPSSDLPSSSPPQPTFKDEPPPPPPPKDFIADAEHDKAPLSAKTLYPSEKVTINGRPYRRTATSTSDSCTDAAHSGLGPVLKRHGCRALYRATFTRDGLAVTVGIAAFSDTRAAAQVKKEYQPNLVALPGGGVPDFCRTVTCRTTANSLGRYAYFTIAGRTDGKASGPEDEAAQRAALDGSNYGYARVLQRGRAQSSAAAEEPGS